jgi:hypothetical protein
MLNIICQYERKKISDNHSESKAPKKTFGFKGDKLEVRAMVKLQCFEPGGSGFEIR